MTGDPKVRVPQRPPTASAATQRCGYCGEEATFALAARAAGANSGPVCAYFECSACGALLLASTTSDADVDPAGASAREAADQAALHAQTDYYTARQHIPRRPSPLLRAFRARVARFRLALGSGRLARALSGRRYGRCEWFRRTRTGQGDSILDVGCGSGRLLFRLHADGFRDLVGIDPHLPPQTEARAADRPGLRFERTAPEAHRGRYHLVMAHHSFEHMRDPRRSFAALAALVAPGGCLLLRTPRADSWARRHYDGAWAQLDPPRHLHIPTRASIERLAATEGFELFHVEDDSGPFQILGSEPRQLGGAIARGIRWLAARRQAARLRRAGLGDQAAYYLRRTVT